MHGDSLLMLTTKVVSNKKPPLLSDSESGGSTSLMPILKYYDLDYVYTTNDILLSIQFIIFVVMIWIEIYSASKIKNKI